MRWCDADCRNEYDEALRRALMRGS